MNENPFLHVKSAKFTILPGEADELVNDGMYGKSFALYLQSKLADRGYSTPRVVAEDWGWWLEVDGLGFACGIGVYGMQIDDTEALDLCVTVLTPRGRKWSWAKLRSIDTMEAIDRLHETIRRVCDRDEDIRVIGETPDFPLGCAE